MNNSQSILAVDDTFESLTLMANILTMAGYRVRPADSGELALAAVAANPPDLILLDVRMGGMSGLDTCQDPSRTGPCEPFNRTSGFGAPRDQRAARAHCRGVEEGSEAAGAR